MCLVAIFISFTKILFLSGKVFITSDILPLSADLPDITCTLSQVLIFIAF